LLEEEEKHTKSVLDVAGLDLVDLYRDYNEIDDAEYVNPFQVTDHRLHVFEKEDTEHEGESENSYRPFKNTDYYNYGNQEEEEHHHDFTEE